MFVALEIITLVSLYETRIGHMHFYIFYVIKLYYIVYQE